MGQVSWSPEEVAYLKRLVWEGKKDFAIGRLLGRSLRSVREKRSRLGLNRHRCADSLVRRLVACGLTDAQIGAELGLSRSAVWSIRTRLKLPAGRWADKQSGIESLPRCWECNRLAPFQANNRPAGWHSRPTGLHGMFELYCPGCFEQIGGWSGNVKKNIA